MTAYAVIDSVTTYVVITVVTTCRVTNLRLALALAGPCAGAARGDWLVVHIVGALIVRLAESGGFGVPLSAARTETDFETAAARAVTAQNLAMDRTAIAFVSEIHESYNHVPTLAHVRRTQQSP